MKGHEYMPTKKEMEQFDKTPLALMQEFARDVILKFGKTYTEASKVLDFIRKYDVHNTNYKQKEDRK